MQRQGYEWLSGKLRHVHFRFRGERVGCRDGHDEVFVDDDAGPDTGGHEIPPTEADLDLVPEDAGERGEREILAVEPKFNRWVSLSGLPGQYSHEYVGRCTGIGERDSPCLPSIGGQHGGAGQLRPRAPRIDADRGDILEWLHAAAPRT